MIRGQEAVLDRVRRKQNLGAGYEEIERALARDSVLRDSNPRQGAEVWCAFLREQLASGEHGTTRVLNLSVPEYRVIGGAAAVWAEAFAAGVPSIVWSMFVIVCLALTSYALVVLALVDAVGALPVAIPGALAFVTTGLAVLNFSLIWSWLVGRFPAWASQRPR